MTNYYDGFDVRPFTLWLEVFTASQNVAANTSTVTGYLRIRKDGNSTPWNDSTSPYGITINGSNSTGNITYDMRPLGVGMTHWVGSFTVVVPHNADGTKSISVSANFNDSAGQLDFATLSGTYNLATIPRASVPTLSDNDFNAGDTITILSHRASASFNHTITYSFQGATGTIATNSAGIPTANGDYVWTAPLSLLNQIPNTTSGTGTITVTTLSGGSSIGTRSVNFTLRAASSVVPSFTFTSGNISEGNPAVTAAAIGQYVQNVSKVTANIAGAAGGQGATVVSQQITVAGQTIVGSSGTTALAINASGTVPVVATVTDSRGRSTSTTVNLNVLAYTPPVIGSMTVERSNVSGTPQANGEYVRVNLVASTASLVVGTQKNNMTIKTFARVRGTTPWGTERSSVVDADRTFSGFYVVAGALFDDEIAYDIRVEVSDKFNIAPGERSISTAGITMHWDDGGGVGVGKFWSQGGLDVAGQIYQNDGLLVLDTGSTLSTQKFAEPAQLLTQNLNTLNVPGWYIQSLNAGATPALNYPIARAGFLEVIKHDSGSNDFFMQRYTTVAGTTSDDARTWQRVSFAANAFAWSSWVEVHTDNSPGVPFRTAAGQAAIGASGVTTINFPAGRFTVAPRVTATMVTATSGQVSIIYISSVPTSTSFGARIYNLAGTQGSGTIDWHAVQMTPSAASG